MVLKSSDICDCKAKSKVYFEKNLDADLNEI